MRSPGPDAFDPVLNLIREEGRLPGAGDPTWDECASQLAAQGLAGTALTLLSRAGRLGDLTPAARSLLEEEMNRVRVSQTMLFHRFGDLARLLGSSGVEFIVHKGGALAPLLYVRLEDRPMVDIDILIRPAAWQRARDALAAARYRLPEGALQSFWLENYFNLSVASPKDPPSHFDIHWSLTQEGRYHIDTGALFSRAVSYEMEGARLLRLGNEDCLLSLFLHLAYHYFDAHLIWLYDMKLLIRRWEIDWDLLLARASSWGLKTVVAFNIAFLEKVFPGLVPAAVVDRARCGALRQALVRPLLSSSPRHLFKAEEDRPRQLVLGLLAIDRPADAARFAGDKIGRSLKWIGRRPRRR